MHTSTAKAVLAPLADAVSSLIVMVSESEINQTPLPDLVNLSRVVFDQVKNLADVASKISLQATADEQLRREMPSAASEGIIKNDLLQIA
jgi:hypothetical protein